MGYTFGGKRWLLFGALALACSLDTSGTGGDGSGGSGGGSGGDDGGLDDGADDGGDSGTGGGGSGGDDGGDGGDGGSSSSTSSSSTSSSTSSASSTSSSSGNGSSSSSSSSSSTSSTSSTSSSSSSGGGDCGSYCNCERDEDCDGQYAFCLSIQGTGDMGPRVCGEGCFQSQDCPESSAGGNAEPECVPVGMGGACILTCEGGRQCPPGMECQQLMSGDLCFWP